MLSLTATGTPSERAGLRVGEPIDRATRACDSASFIVAPDEDVQAVAAGADLVARGRSHAFTVVRRA